MTDLTIEQRVERLERLVIDQDLCLHRAVNPSFICGQSRNHPMPHRDIRNPECSWDTGLHHLTRPPEADWRGQLTRVKQLQHWFATRQEADSYGGNTVADLIQEALDDDPDREGKIEESLLERATRDLKEFHSLDAPAVGATDYVMSKRRGSWAAINSIARRVVSRHGVYPINASTLAKIYQETLDAFDEQQKERADERSAVDGS